MYVYTYIFLVTFEIKIQRKVVNRVIETSCTKLREITMCVATVTRLSPLTLVDYLLATILVNREQTFGIGDVARGRKSSLAEQKRL